jgi:dTDP-4-amino-4,6-dideoxygalactose transaminase
MKRPTMLCEAPPTAGLPLEWRYFLQGSQDDDLGTALARFLAVGSVGISCSGTAALIVALEALRRRSGRRTVVLPAYTCPLVPLAVAKVGLQVKLCDLVPGRFDLDPASLDATCDAGTLAVVPTHLAGIVAELDPVLDIAARCGAAVVEDAAQALGGRWRERPAGTLGDIGIYSFSRGKGLTIYEGGAWTARDSELHAAMTRIADELFRPRPGLEWLRILQLVGYRLLYNPLGMPLVYGIPLRRALARGDLLGAVGDEQRSSIPLHPVGRWRSRIGAAALRRLSDANRANAERGRARAEALRQIRGLAIVEELPGTTGTWPFLTVVVDARETRDRVLSGLWAKGVGVTRLFLHDLTGYSYLEQVVPRAAVPNARAIAERSFTITNSPFFSDEAFEWVRQSVAREL